MYVYDDFIDYDFIEYGFFDFDFFDYDFCNHDIFDCDDERGRNLNDCGHKYDHCEHNSGALTLEDVGSSGAKQDKKTDTQKLRWKQSKQMEKKLKSSLK